MSFTPHAQVNAMLAALLPGLQGVLGENLVGVYLRGSLALGDFDEETSDLDFLAVTEQPVSEAEFAALAELHLNLAKLPNKYANRMEGAYLDRASLRRFGPGKRHPTLYSGEAFARGEHRQNWLLERWTLRERGVALLGPSPKTLIDSISFEELRAAALARLQDWATWAEAPDDPNWPLPRSHQAYVVETMCRALHTLASGELASKPRSVRWALESLPDPWRDLVRRSREWKDDLPNPTDLPGVLAFARWAASQNLFG